MDVMAIFNCICVVVLPVALVVVLADVADRIRRAWG